MIGSKGSLEKVVIIVVCNNLLLKLYDTSNLESDKKDFKLVDYSEQVRFCPHFGSKKYCWLIQAEDFLKSL